MVDPAVLSFIRKLQQQKDQTEHTLLKKLSKVHLTDMDKELSTLKLSQMQCRVVKELQRQRHVQHETKMAARVDPDILFLDSLLS